MTQTNTALCFPRWVHRCRWKRPPDIFNALFRYLFTFRTYISFQLNVFLSFTFYTRHIRTHTPYWQHTHTHMHTCSAPDCIIPTPPMNGRLIAQTDNTLTYLCDSTYVFRDTNNSSRTLICTDRNIWDKSLPHCVGTLSITLHNEN